MWYISWSGMGKRLRSELGERWCMGFYSCWNAAGGPWTSKRMGVACDCSYSSLWLHLLSYIIEWCLYAVAKRPVPVVLWFGYICLPLQTLWHLLASSCAWDLSVCPVGRSLLYVLVMVIESQGGWTHLKTLPLYTDSIPKAPTSAQDLRKSFERPENSSQQWRTSRWASWSLSAKTHVPSLCGSRRGKRGKRYQLTILQVLKRLIGEYKRLYYRIYNLNSHTHNHTWHTCVYIHNIK